MGECSVLHALTWLKRATNATNASNAFATALTGKTWPLQNSMTLLALYTLHTATYWCWPYSTQWLVNAQKHKMTSTCRALTAQYTKETTWHQHVPAARNLLVNYSETASGNAAILMSAAKVSSELCHAANLEGALCSSSSSSTSCSHYWGWTGEILQVAGTTWG